MNLPGPPLLIITDRHQARAPLAALAGAATVLGYAAKIFLGFRVARERYQHVVTDSLYNKNMGNDLGVIFYLINALEEFKNLGIDFVSYQENIDTSSPLGSAIFTIISAVAQLERD
ncbi:MAG: DUF3754 domain-containing protein, partial [Proteobacteria bacterium]|nr:DUF3754 domain-containing protein [Pseudomonadota bacterium]